MNSAFSGRFYETVSKENPVYLPFRKLPDSDTQDFLSFIYVVRE